MGKSPGKWIKTILFGKKSSKSNLSKGRERNGNEKEVLVSAKASETTTVISHPVASHPTSNTIDINEGVPKVTNNEAANVLHERSISIPGNQDAEVQGSTCQDAPSDPERIREEEAATKAQAAFRGYLARRAFRALKGIIRLQALIRGHLVRRQAAATLCCMLGIVKFQAIARGRRVRLSDVGFEVQSKCRLVQIQDRPLVDPAGVSLSSQMAKLSANAFTMKLASSTTSKPMQLYFDTGDENSVLKWLERWSNSRFWKPIPQVKKAPESKTQRRLSTGQAGEAHNVRSKRTRRVSSANNANNDSTAVQPSSEFEKPKRNFRKVSSHSAAEQVQENPQMELEKVKRSLRKVHNPVAENPAQTEFDVEKPKESLEKASNGLSRDLLARGTSNSSEKMKKEAISTNPVQPDLETMPEQLPTKEVVNVPNTDPVVDSPPLIESSNIDKSVTGDEAAEETKPLTEIYPQDEISPLPNGESNHKEDFTNNENPKSGRKSSTPAKQERVENGLQHSPTLPSYMAATESAKAKLRAQGSPRFGQDSERSNLNRRHSLPSPTNAKISSQSPRTQRLTQAGGKGGNRNDKALLGSRDGNGKPSPIQEPSPSSAQGGAAESFGFRRLGDAPRATPFWTQANALLIKNLTYQKRNLRRNISLISFPIILCSLLAAIQTFVDKNLDNPDLNCGCACVDKNGDGKCEKVCGIEYSSPMQAPNCPNPSPPRWAPVLQMPAPNFRAVRTDFFPYTDLPNESCRESASCPVTMLFTGKNRSLGNILAGNMVPSSLFWNSSDAMNAASLNVLGSEKKPTTGGYVDSTFFSSLPLYYILRQCVKSPTVSIPVSLFSLTNAQKVACVQGLQLWRNSSSQVNDEIYRGYINGNPEGKINEILSGFDFLNSDRNNFNVTIWYNSSYKASAGSPNVLLRVPRLVNLVSNGYLKFMLGAGTEMPFQFVKEMPKHETKTQIDFSSNLGALFFTWVILQPFPVILTSLVSEKQQKLRIMMKMHGLGDGPYWMISYAYFLTVYAVYMFCFVMFGSVIGLDFFTMNDYGIQLVFYLLFINVLVSVAFLMAGMFSDVKTAEVSAYIGVFGTGLLGGFLFQFFIEDPSFPHGWLILMELYPGFMLYRGLYEFAFFSVTGKIIGTSGMQWGDLTDSTNGMGEILIIMLFEWIVVLLIAYYIDQVLSSGKHPLFFLQRHDKKTTSNNLVLERQRSKVVVQIDKHDVREEREKVERLLNERHPGHGVICDHLKKVYPGRDGNPEKFAVRGLSLAIDRGECFGMLGPNGAGKTSFISMMIGLTKPTAGTAFVEGLDIRTEMNAVYESMGVCPQHDLLWDNLTGREHLLFYGRLKSLKGSALIQAVEESLKEVNLFKGGVADKQAGMYSGGMKRRLSVAISLIGDPKVVYMDEPSTGLDPASRKTLWNAVKHGKQDRAIILTTHSMEEAEVLCDRIGIFVDGCLQCVGHPKELKARYGGVYVFTMTTSAVHEGYVEDMVKQLAPGSNKIYHLSGTQKFELPKHEVRIADVFLAVEKAKSRFAVLAWGLSDTTLEDVFIKVAKGAKTSHMLS